MFSYLYDPAGIWRSINVLLSCIVYRPFNVVVIFFVHPLKGVLVESWSCRSPEIQFRRRSYFLKIVYCCDSVQYNDLYFVTTRITVLNTNNNNHDIYFIQTNDDFFNVFFILW